jgi:hypothetical protein
MPDWLIKRDKQIKAKPLRGRHPNKRPLGKPRGERHAKSTKTGTGRGAGKA